MKGDKHLVSSSRYNRILGGSNQVTNGLKLFTEKGEFIKGVKITLDTEPANLAVRKMTDSTVMLFSYSAKNSIPCYTFTIFSDNLTVLWSKSIQTYTLYDFAGSTLDALDLHRDQEGNYYFLGTSTGFMSTPKLLVYKMDASGNQVWLKRMNSTRTSISDL